MRLPPARVLLELVDHALVEGVGHQVGHGRGGHCGELHALGLELPGHLVIAGEQVVELADAGQGLDFLGRTHPAQHGVQGQLDALQGRAHTAELG